MKKFLWQGMRWIWFSMYSHLFITKSKSRNYKNPNLWNRGLRWFWIRRLWIRARFTDWKWRAWIVWPVCITSSKTSGSKIITQFWQFTHLPSLFWMFQWYRRFQLLLCPWYPRNGKWLLPGNKTGIGTGYPGPQRDANFHEIRTANFNIRLPI